MDRKFECLSDNILESSDFKTTAAKEHVTYIERHIWVIKEQ